MSDITIGGRGIRIARFTALSAARDYADRRQGRMIVLGDDQRFWVVSRGDAERLVREGYQLA